MYELPIRIPAVAGQFYPGKPRALRKMVEGHIHAATLPEGLDDIRAVIAPHAGYIYSGPIGGYAFKALTTLPRRSWTVFLLGPAHRMYFSGVALGNYSSFRTPLGDAPIAVDRVESMLARSGLYTREPRAHAQEHSLEVEIPFLQVGLQDFQIVPMLFGDVDPSEVGAELVDHLGDGDLIVVSNDLSHMHPYASAQQLDNALLDALMAGDEMGVLHGEACGRAPIATLMHVAHHKNWEPHLLDYRNSGDTAGDKRQVVGYASVAYTEA